MSLALGKASFCITLLFQENKIKKQHIQLNSAQENIEAIMPSSYIQNLLELPSNIPIFYRERLTYDINDIPVEYVEMFYRSDDYKYTIKLNINKNK